MEGGDNGQFFQEVRHGDCSPLVPFDKQHLWAGLYTAQYVFICGRDRGWGGCKGMSCDAQKL